MTSSVACFSNHLSAVAGIHSGSSRRQTLGGQRSLNSIRQHSEQRRGLEMEMEIDQGLGGEESLAEEDTAMGEVPARVTATASAEHDTAVGCTRSIILSIYR